MASAASADLPRLGIGLTYSSAIEPVLARWPELIDVPEFEPQTTWLRTSSGYRPNEQVHRRLLDLPGRKLVHSVGAPVGGTVRPDPAQVVLLRETVQMFGSPWLSEHLSFNATHGFPTGFFLPPRQTLEGASGSAAAVSDLRAAVGVSIAVETGANYLRRRDDEMDDGAFAACVAAQSGCGILLDLHNLLANSRNGRQPIDSFLDQIPLDRVWEMHLAGGMEAEGYWLDAHSGAMPDELVAIAELVIPRLPNLGAIVFEIFPSFVPLAGFELVRDQLQILQGLWALRAPRDIQVPEVDPGRVPVAGGAGPAEWEVALGTLAIGRPAIEGPIASELAADPAIPLVAGLIQEFRGSMIVDLLPLTSRLLMLALGVPVSRVIFRDYWAKLPPQMYASREAMAFAEYLDGIDLLVPHLRAVLRFERAVLATLVDGQTRVVPFDFEPLPLLRSLAEGRLPDFPAESGAFEIELTADGVAGTVRERLLQVS